MTKKKIMITLRLTEWEYKQLEDASKMSEKSKSSIIVAGMLEKIERMNGKCTKN